MVRAVLQALAVTYLFPVALNAYVIHPAAPSGVARACSPGNCAPIQLSVDGSELASTPPSRPSLWSASSRRGLTPTQSAPPPRSEPPAALGTAFASLGLFGATSSSPKKTAPPPLAPPPPARRAWFNRVETDAPKAATAMRSTPSKRGAAKGRAATAVRSTASKRRSAVTLPTPTSAAKAARALRSLLAPAAIAEGKTLTTAKRHQGKQGLLLLGQRVEFGQPSPPEVPPRPPSPSSSSSSSAPAAAMLRLGGPLKGRRLGRPVLPPAQAVTRMRRYGGASPPVAETPAGPLRDLRARVLAASRVVPELLAAPLGSLIARLLTGAAATAAAGSRARLVFANGSLALLDGSRTLAGSSQAAFRSLGSQLALLLGALLSAPASALGMVRDLAASSLRTTGAALASGREGVARGSRSLVRSAMLAAASVMRLLMEAVGYPVSLAHFAVEGSLSLARAAVAAVLVNLAAVGESSRESSPVLPASASAVAQLGAATVPQAAGLGRIAFSFRAALFDLGEGLVCAAVMLRASLGHLTRVGQGRVASLLGAALGVLGAGSQAISTIVAGLLTAAAAVLASMRARVGVQLLRAFGLVPYAKPESSKMSPERPQPV
ncbi:hypothetical protein T492DRAFT_960398 [Pavlovales sp. CCMP2436]|nr:hypothetical protein T492DRAFT_960398 [Pavlovales sp. CCMP2436]